MLGTTVDTYPYSLFGMRSWLFSSYGRQKLRQPSRIVPIYYSIHYNVFYSPKWTSKLGCWKFLPFRRLWDVLGYPIWSLSPFSTNVGLVPNKIRLFSGTFVEKMMMNNCCLDHLGRWGIFLFDGGFSSNIIYSKDGLSVATFTLCWTNIAMENGHL